jgi:hypothetical protein
MHRTVGGRSSCLRHRPRTANLAVVRADGSPDIAPVWIDLDGEDVVFMTAATTLKGKAILGNPRMCLCGTTNAHRSAS